jgi:hypothetical protein
MNQSQLFTVVFALSGLAAPTVFAQEGRGQSDVEQLKQIVATQQKTIQLLEARVARLEETHRILGFDEYVKAAKAAREMGPVRPSAKPVLPQTQLKAGDHVLVEWSKSWRKGQVLEILPNGHVKIHYVGWDAQWDEVVPRMRLQLPAEEAERLEN